MTDHMTPEELAAEKQEWLDYLPEVLEAIEAGYLDNHIGSLAAACLTRTNSVGIVRRGKKPVTTEEFPTTQGEGEVATPSNPTGTQVGYAFHTPGRALIPVGTHSALYSYQVLGDDGSVYTKHDIQMSGQRFVLTRMGTPFKYQGLVLRVVKVNRTKANCEVIASEHSPSSTYLGRTFPIPLKHIITEIQNYNSIYGTV